MPRFAPFFDSTAAILSPELRAAVLATPFPGLGDEPRSPELAGRLNSADTKAMSLPPLAMSGLWLLAGELDRSHTLSQHDPSAEGSFWHGIMHRREADYLNAKYWFRRVGAHAVFSELVQIHNGVFTDPGDFVDAIEKACTDRNPDAATTQSLVKVQWTEWQLLMQACLADFNAADDGKPNG